MKVLIESMKNIKSVNEVQKGDTTAIRESINDFSDTVFYALGTLQKNGDLGGFSIESDTEELADNEMLIKLDNSSDKEAVINKLEQLKNDNEIASYYQNPDDTIVVTAQSVRESKKIKKESQIIQFSVDIEHRGKEFTLQLTKNDANWSETFIGGERPDDFRPSTYMQYLSANDVLTWLRQDFDSVGNMYDIETADDEDY